MTQNTGHMTKDIGNRTQDKDTGYRTQKHRTQDRGHRTQDRET